MNNKKSLDNDLNVMYYNHANNKSKEVSSMSEEKKAEILNELKDALAGIPEKYHEDVAKSLTHDVGVIARTISLEEKQPG